MDILSRMTDEELAVSYVQGNNRAFDLLLSRTQSSLFSYILFIVHDENTANDVFQDAFVKAIMYMQSGKYSPTGKFSVWMTRIAHNAIMDWFRHKRNQNIVDLSNDNDLSVVSNADVMDASRESMFVNEQVIKDVRKLMDKLPLAQREVVYMRFYQEMSFKEISAVTGVSINTSLGRMRYALMNMRKLARQNDIALVLE